MSFAKIIMCAGIAGVITMGINIFREYRRAVKEEQEMMNRFAEELIKHFAENSDEFEKIAAERKRIIIDEFINKKQEEGIELTSEQIELLKEFYDFNQM